MNFRLINDITEYQNLKNQLNVMKNNLHLFQEDEEFNLCYQLIKSSLTFYKTKYENSDEYV
jgi:hypothetical protein|tara:strand:- start:2069 stop:2251 length:183 start_codon:yes stop_codon:yes gene_type:complete